MEVVEVSDDLPITFIYDGKEAIMGLIHDLDHRFMASYNALEAVPCDWIDGEWGLDVTHSHEVKSIEEGIEWIREFYRNTSDPT